MGACSHIWLVLVLCGSSECSCCVLTAYRTVGTIASRCAAEMWCNVGSKTTHLLSYGCLHNSWNTDCWLYHVCPSVSHTCPTAGRTFLKSDKGFVIRSVESIQVWLKSVRNKTNLREYLRTFQYLIINGFHNWDSVLCEVRAVQLVIEHRPWSIADVEISMFQMRV